MNLKEAIETVRQRWLSNDLYLAEALCVLLETAEALEWCRKKLARVDYGYPSYRSVYVEVEGQEPLTGEAPTLPEAVKAAIAGYTARRMAREGKL